MEFSTVDLYFVMVMACGMGTIDFGIAARLTLEKAPWISRIVWACLP